MRIIHSMNKNLRKTIKYTLRDRIADVELLLDEIREELNSTSTLPADANEHGVYRTLAKLEDKVEQSYLLSQDLLQYYEGA